MKDIDLLQILTCNPQLLHLMNFGYWVFTWILTSLPLPPSSKDSQWRNPICTLTSFHSCLFHQSLIFRSTKYRIPGDLCCRLLIYGGQSLRLLSESSLKRLKRKHTNMNMNKLTWTCMVPSPRLPLLFQNKNNDFAKVF